ncbi:MAG TPA: hypothetical protein DCM21_02055 [Butyrivibrio sp.]|nr:hypothetical protein [Butyrivibrio sp.]
MSKVKYLFIALVTFLCIGAPVTIHAEENTDNKEDIFNEINDICVQRKIPVYDFNGELVGVCAECELDSADYGYYIVDRDGGLVEYSVEQGQEFLYDQICETVTQEYDIEEYGLYTKDSIQYFVRASKGENFYLINQSGEVYEIDNDKICSTNKLESWDDIIVDVDVYSGNGRYSLVESYNRPGYAYIDCSIFKQKCKKYACSVVAMVCLSMQEGYFQSRNSNGSLNEANICSAFLKLWNLSKTFVEYTEGGIQYGSTYEKYLQNAIEDYCYIMTKKIISVGVMTDPTYAQIVNVVKKGKSSIFSSHIYVREESGYVKSGHSVNVLGYAIYNDNSNGKKIKILKVADGWNNRARYLVYDSSNFISTHYVFVQ